MPTPPPLDADGNVIPHDHLGILDGDEIIRRVSKQHLVDDPKAIGGRRLSSSLFNPSSEKNGGVSVDLKRHIEEAGHDPKDYVSNPPWVGSVKLIAQDFRSVTLKVGYDPIADNPYHGQVWGNFTGGCKKKLLRLAQWFVPIPDEPLS